jgi:PAS domain S-box-containing protein
MHSNEERLILELRASEARFRTIFENAPIMINSFDREGRVALWNRACTRLLGYTQEEMAAAEDPLLLFYPEPALRDQVLAQIVEADGLFREHTVRHKNAHFVHQMWANFRLPDESIISMGYDISPIRDVQNQLKIANLNLEQKVNERTRELDRERAKLISASKFAALGEMAGGIAHEINNPLAVIGGLADQLHTMSENLPAELQQEMIGSIRSAVTRISKIVSGLRTLSRDASRDPMELYSAQVLIRDMLSFCRERFKNSGVSLDTHLPSEEIFLDCRPVEIGQVLLNLLNNAFDAVREVPGQWVKVVVTELEQAIEFRVIDCGPGIPPELHEKIFQPFFTTKPIGQGTGIGLSISRSIAEGHGGSLVHETGGGETSFVLVLPKRRLKTAR